MNTNKIVPNIWYHTPKGEMAAIIAYYKKVFGKNFHEGQIIPLGESPSGNAEMCEVIIFGQQYCLMSTSKKHHPLNDAVSFIIYCDGQKEIDKYWNYFTAEGEASQCGWCMDKYGVRWQIIPSKMEELMSLPNAYKIMLGQKKIVIAEYF